MTKHLRKHPIIILLIFSFGLILYSCEEDFSNSWIKYHQYNDDLDSEEKPIRGDTLTVSINEKFILRIKTQSNNRSKPSIFKQIDNSEVIDISNNQSEASLESYYEDEDVYKQINKIYINLNESFFSPGQTIKYITKIGSKDGMIEKELIIKIDK